MLCFIEINATFVSNSVKISVETETGRPQNSQKRTSVFLCMTHTPVGEEVVVVVVVGGGGGGDFSDLISWECTMAFLCSIYLHF